MLQTLQYTPPLTAAGHEGLTNAYSDEQPMVSELEQLTVLQRIDGEIDREYFYFSINLRKNQIMHCNGVTRWLGYPDADFSLERYRKIIHPTHAPLQTYYGMSLLELLKRKKISLRFMQPVCNTTIALKHKNGKYIYCKRECAPFQLNEENRMTEYLCRFSIIKKFSNESYHTRLYGGNEQMDEKLLELVQEKFENHIGFSVQESRILRRYAQQKNCTSEMIARAFRIEKSTVETHNKRILKKTETLLQQRFATAKAAALYFKQMGLI